MHAMHESEKKVGAKRTLPLKKEKKKGQKDAQSCPVILKAHARMVKDHRTFVPLLEWNSAQSGLVK